MSVLEFPVRLGQAWGCGPLALFSSGNLPLNVVGGT